MREFTDSEVDGANGIMIGGLREWITKRYSDDHFETTDRDLIFTPIFANHGTVSNWVVSVLGSPPKGTLFVFAGLGGYCYYLDHTGQVIVTCNDDDFNEEFIEEHLHSFIGNMVEANGGPDTFVVKKEPVHA